MDNNEYNPVQTNTMPFKAKLFALIWKVVNKTIFKYSPFFAAGWRRMLLRVFGAKIHSTSSPNRLAVVDYPWNLVMGAYSSIGPASWIYALDKIVIEKKSCIGAGVQLLTGSHSITSLAFDLITNPIKIESCCWIATSSIVTPVVIVGQGSIIGAGSVVTKDVAPWTVVAGNPAKFIKKRVIKGGQNEM